VQIDDVVFVHPLTYSYENKCKSFAHAATLYVMKLYKKEQMPSASVKNKVVCLLFLTCICLWRLLFHVTLEMSRTVINLAYCDIVTSQRGHWPLLIRTRYVCTCVGASSGMGGGVRKIKAIRWGAYYYSLVLNAQPCKYGQYRHRCF
jgi:hypothetical protein